MLSPNLDLLKNAGHMLCPNSTFGNMFLKKKVQFESFFTDVATSSDKILRTSQWPSLGLHL
jgi:hypothetical protein